MGHLTLTLGKLEEFRPRALQRASGCTSARGREATVLSQCVGGQAAGRSTRGRGVAVEALGQRRALVLAVLQAVRVKLLIAVGAAPQRLQGGCGTPARGRCGAGRIVLP